MFEIITLAYWHITPIKGCPWEHGEKIVYSAEKLEEIQTQILSLGLSMMLIPNENTLTLYIGRGKMRQK